MNLEKTPKLRVVAIVLFILALSPALSGAVMYGMPDDKDLKVKAGDAAPLFFPDLKKAHESGKAIVLMFGNPDHCTFCERTWRSVTDAAPKFGDKIFVIKVNYRRSDFAPPEKEHVELAKQYGVTGEPWVFLIDKHGVVRTIFKGLTGQADMESKIAEMLAGN